MFNLVEDLAKAAIAANLPKSQAQLVNYGLHVVKKTADFERALGDWYDRPPHEHTWVNFKTHFTAAQRKLKKIRGPTVRDTTFHQVNQLATKLTEDFSSFKSDVLTSLHDLGTSPPPGIVQPLPPSSYQRNVETANAMPSVPTDLAQLIKDLQDKVNRLSVGSTHVTPPVRRSFRPRRNTEHYCWTHGAFAHDSKDCKHKASGHQDAATFQNKMGGSTYYCQPSSNKA